MMHATVLPVAFITHAQKRATLVEKGDAGGDGRRWRNIIMKWRSLSFFNHGVLLFSCSQSHAHIPVHHHIPSLIHHSLSPLPFPPSSHCLPSPSRFTSFCRGTAWALFSDPLCILAPTCNCSRGEGVTDSLEPTTVLLWGAWMPKLQKKVF